MIFASNADLVDAITQILVAQIERQEQIRFWARLVDSAVGLVEVVVVFGIALWVYSLFLAGVRRGWQWLVARWAR